MGFKEYFAEQTEKNRQLRVKRMQNFYRDYRQKMINLADRSTGIVSFNNGKLDYTPGSSDNIQYVDLWNDFQQRAREKKIQIDKNTFDGIWKEFERMKYDKWLEAYDFANESGATKKDFDNLYRDNPTYRRDGLDVSAKAFPQDEFGQAARAQFSSNFMPTGGDDFMNRTEGMSFEKVKDWAVENPMLATGAGVGTYMAGKHWGPGMLDRAKNIGMGKPSLGGLGPGLGVYGTGEMLKFGGSLLGMEDEGRVAGDVAQIGLGGRGLYNSMNVKGSSDMVRKRLASNLAKSSPQQLIANAKALGVDSKTIKTGSRKNASAKSIKTLQKAVKNKVLNQSLNKTMATKGVNKIAVKAATTLGTKALARTALSSLGPIGLAANIGWGVYDLGDYMGWWGGDEPEQPVQNPAPEKPAAPTYNFRTSSRTY